MINVWVVVLSVISFAVILYLFSSVQNNKKEDNPLATGKTIPWWMVAISLVGTTLSGVTFISVPGLVSTSSKMGYLQFVLGNCIGFLAIAFFILPFYYRFKVDSIYQFLGSRFGYRTHKTASFLFIISRLIGSAFRLYLGCLILYVLGFEEVGIPLPYIIIFVVVCIWAYTRRGGLQNIIKTDFLQTILLLSVAIFVFVALFFVLPKDLGWHTLWTSQHNVIFEFDNFWTNKNHFAKQIIAGIFITIAMSGLDQDMMQKNLKFKTLKVARKNYVLFTIAFLVTNVFFMYLGLLFYEVMRIDGIAIPLKTDTIFAFLCELYIGKWGIVLFVIGVLAATFSSCASSLISLSSSFVLDINSIKPSNKKKFVTMMNKSHLGVSIAFLVVLLIFHLINETSIVMAVFKMASYTYGPLLGIFTLGFFTKLKIKDSYTPYVALSSIIISIIVDYFSTRLLGGYKFGFEILLVNALLCIFGLLLTSLLGNDNKIKKPHLD